ncbi:hypothetical protein D915_005584 [Fasciola hepatica]|uniref:Cilia- and flagella-associated protein 300 n=1 Tax=Fasciola hepatica TaxID=6192 RepID=A0A4E0R9D4_FASHE|nr:hypothetical protein D915_005584 [Fasciola hepatica]
MPTEDKGDIKFTFLHLENRDYPALISTDTQNSLMKWSMKGRLNVHTFSFDENFMAYEVQTFLKVNFANYSNNSVTSVQKNLFTSNSVIAVVHGDGFLVPSKFELVVENVPCTFTSLNVFRKVRELTARSDGTIKRCYDDVIDSVLVSDELRKCLLDTDSDTYGMLTEDERNQFLFRIFKHLCLGGELCQSEDNIDVYIELVRKLYRDLISVQKNPESRELQIISRVYSVKLLENDKLVFPSAKEHPNTFAYTIVDPLKRNVILLYHVFGCGDF